MNNTEKYTDRDWEILAAAMSDSAGDKVDDSLTRGNWNNIKKIEPDTPIDVDKAWSGVNKRIDERKVTEENPIIRILYTRKSFIRVAASVIIILGLSSLMLIWTGLLSKNIVVTTSNLEKNQVIQLPDGSNVILNRNTKLTYRNNFGKHSRNVFLSGEAFFDVAKDSVNPFTIDAGKAKIKVVGTSFNVITSNSDADVEVFVKTGKVLLIDKSGAQNIILNPGYIGVMGSQRAGKEVNNDPNYLAWNTGQLKYDGQSLSIVLTDLKKVFDADIIVDEPTILNETWTSPAIDNESLDTIIQLICGSFNLSYTKDGELYHLSRK